MDLHFQWKLHTLLLLLSYTMVGWIIMKHSCEDQWLQIDRGFVKDRDFQNCIRVTDRKHIRIINPIDGILIRGAFLGLQCKSKM